MTTPELITVTHHIDDQHRKQVSFHGNWTANTAFIDRTSDGNDPKVWAFATTANHGIVAFRCWYKSAGYTNPLPPEVGDFLQRYATFDELALDLVKAGFKPELLDHIRKGLVWHSVEHHDDW